jgi:hypothetical protein
MAQYQPFSSSVEVAGDSALAFVNAIPAYKDTMVTLLKKNNIAALESGKWYKQAMILNVLKEVGEKYGSNSLFSIGKAIIDHAQLPPFINTLETALNSINEAYKLNHRHGAIGYYKVLEYNSKNRFAIMECSNPYPSFFDKGLITGFTRRFKPTDSVMVDVQLDDHSPSRVNGADSCTFRITW